MSTETDTRMLEAFADAWNRHDIDEIMSMMTDERLAQLRTILQEEWKRKGLEMEQKKRAVLFDESEELILRAMCRWTGVPLTDAESWRRAYEVGVMIDAAGGVGKRYREGEKVRTETEGWIQEVIEAVRDGRMKTEEGTPVHTVAFHEEEGELLDALKAFVQARAVARKQQAPGYPQGFEDTDALENLPGPLRAKVFRKGERATIAYYAPEVFDGEIAWRGKKRRVRAARREFNFVVFG